MMKAEQKSDIVLTGLKIFRQQEGEVWQRRKK